MSETWRQYICRACGVIYDEALGDPDSGLAPGTRFEDIPDDWACPICGVTKADFELYERRVAITPSAAAPVVVARKPGVVIVGGGAAAWAVAMALRGLDAETPITLVTACAGDIYHKPELSIALSRGASVDSLRREDGAQAAARIGVRLLAHTHAIAIEAARNRLRTTRGSIGYSHLVLAHGARPALPSQLPPELCWRVNDLRAWGGLRAKIGDAPRRIAIVGAGMVGCELAEDFARAGHAVTLLDVQPLPLAGLLPNEAARRLARGLAACGVRFVGGVAVKTLRRLETGALTLALNGAVTIEADIVTVAAGLTVDPRLARTAGLAFERGVVVDAKTLQTSVAGIFALGDCVSIHGQPCRFIEPIAGQAEAIAHTLAGRDHAGYAHNQPVIRLKTRSTPIVIHGAPDPDAPWRLLKDDADGLVMEQWRDGALQSRLAA